MHSDRTTPATHHAPTPNSILVHWNRPLQFHSLAGSLAASTQLNFCRLFPRCSPHGTPALLEDLDRRLRLVGRGGGEAQLRDQPSLVMKLRPPRLSLEHHQLPHQPDTPVPPLPPVRASPADGWVHIDVERHFVIGVVRLAQAGERVGDRILRSRDVLVTNRHEGALELLGILVERHEALR